MLCKHFDCAGRVNTLIDDIDSGHRGGRRGIDSKSAGLEDVLRKGEVVAENKGPALNGLDV